MFQQLADTKEIDVYLHKILLTINWSILANFSVFFSLYRYRKYYLYIHIALSCIIMAITIVMTLLLLIPKGFQFGQGHKPIQNIHNVIGVIVLTTIFFQFAMGILVRFQEITHVKYVQLLKIKKIHRFLGFLLISLSKFSVLSGWYKRYKYKNQYTVFFMVLLWQALWICLFMMRKTMQTPTLQKNVQHNQIQKLGFIPRVSDIYEVQNSNDSILFANYIYDATPLYSNHPGGYEVIKAIIGRDVDRFLYGMYSPEKLQQIGTHIHSKRSLQLVGKPIAKLSIGSTFLGMKPINICKVAYKIRFNDHYILGLQVVSNGEFKYRGYHQLKELGRYYAVNLKQRTRLYTMVNCIRNENINFVSKLPMISKQQFDKISMLMVPELQSQLIDKDSNMRFDTANLVRNQTQSKYNEIPIMFKKYPQGQFSSMLSNLQENDELTISQQRGIGMRLHATNPGMLIFIAGGTGLYPFMDLIDLLFKSQVLDKNTNKDLIQQNPILLTQNLFKKFSFTFLIAVNDISSMHPLTLFQLGYLAKKRKQQFRCYMRVFFRQASFKEQYSDFILMEKKFEQILKTFLNQGRLSKIFICGPPAMNTGIAKFMEQQFISTDKYVIL